MLAAQEALEGVALAQVQAVLELQAKDLAVEIQQVVLLVQGVVVLVQLEQITPKAALTTTEVLEALELHHLYLVLP